MRPLHKPRRFKLPERMPRQAGVLSPRIVAFIVVLLIVLLIPLVWLNKKTDQREKLAAQEKAAQQVAASATAGAQPISPAEISVNNPEAFGMSWGSMAQDKLPPETIWMSCHGQPRDGLSKTHKDSCNPYSGDASCRLALPILCFQPDGAASQPALPDSVGDGWAGGQVASSQPVAGFVIGSLQAAHARCEKELGAGWRMASFHEGQGGRAGWGFVSKRHAQLSTNLRHWVHIGDQPGNCWNNKEAK
jgi:hypothetical protein